MTSSSSLTKSVGGGQFTHRVSEQTLPPLPAVPGRVPLAHPHGQEPSGKTRPGPIDLVQVFVLLVNLLSLDDVPVLRAWTRSRTLPSFQNESPPLLRRHDELRNSVLGQSLEDLQHVPQLERELEGLLAHKTQLAQVPLALAIGTLLARVQ